MGEGWDESYGDGWDRLSNVSLDAVPIQVLLLPSILAGVLPSILPSIVWKKTRGGLRDTQAYHIPPHAYTRGGLRDTQAEITPLRGHPNTPIWASAIHMRIMAPSSIWV